MAGIAPTPAFTLSLFWYRSYVTLVFVLRVLRVCKSGRLISVMSLAARAGREVFDETLDLGFDV